MDQVMDLLNVIRVDIGLAEGGDRHRDRLDFFFPPTRGHHHLLKTARRRGLLVGLLRGRGH